MAEERLQKLLARAGVGSRRKVEEMVREGRVTVNGQAAQIGQKVDAGRDAVKVDGRRIALEAVPSLYLLVHKPRAVMSTVADPEGRPTVLELVPAALRKALVPVGRLDFMTSGLMLLTTDGELAQRVAHPRYGCTKTYEVKVSGQPAEDRLDRLRTGIVLEGRKTAPCRIETRTVTRDRRASGDNSWWTVELGEGRGRQIREMFQRIGHPVQKLRRIAIGPVRDPYLPPGEYRELTEREVELLRRSTPRAARRRLTKPPKERTAGASAAAGRRRSRPPGKRGDAGAKRSDSGTKRGGAGTQRGDGGSKTPRRGRRPAGRKTR